MSTSKLVFNNTIVQVAGRAFSMFVGLVVVTALTRHLGVAGYGQYTTIFAYVGLAALLTDSGLFYVLLRRISTSDTDQIKIASDIFTLRLALGIILYVTAFLLAFLIPAYSRVIVLGIGILSIAYFAQTLNATLVAILQAKMKMSLAVAGDIIGRILLLAFILWVTRSGGSLLVILVGYVLAHVATLLFVIFQARRFIPFRLRFNPGEWRAIFIEAIPIGIVSVLGYLYFRIDTLILSLLKGSYDVGIYGAPYKIIDLALILPGFFIAASFPVLARYLHKESERIHIVLQKMFDGLVVLSAPIFVGALVAAPAIIRVLSSGNVDANFTTAATVTLFGHPVTAIVTLQILAFLLPLSYVSVLFGALITAQGRQRELIMPNLILVVGNALLNILLVPLFSYAASAIITVVTEIVVLWIGFVVTRRHFALRLGTGVLWRSYAAAAVMGLALWPLREYSAVLLIPLGAAIYAAAGYLFGALKKDLVQSIITKDA